MNNDTRSLEDKIVQNAPLVEWVNDMSMQPPDGFALIKCLFVNNANFSKCDNCCNHKE